MSGLVLSSPVLVERGSSELVVSDGEDGDFWDEEDGEFPYHLGDFPPAILLDWALFRDEGIEDLIEDTPWKVSNRILSS
jgi:hypothetical protein